GRTVATQRVEGDGAYDRGLPPIARQRDQSSFGVDSAGATCGDRLAVVRSRPGRVPVPLLDPRGRPLWRPVLVASSTGIGRAQFHGQIRTGNPEAVVAARVHHHVVLLGHVAVDALGAGRPRLMKVVRDCVIDLVSGRAEAGVTRRPVTTGAQRIAGAPELPRMRIMAIGAPHALLIHPALTERAVLVHLAQLLTVGMIESGRQSLRPVLVEERMPGPVGGVERDAP